MFIEQRKKKNYRTFIYAAIIVVLCLIILVVAWPADSSTLAADGNSPESADGQEKQDAQEPAENDGKGTEEINETEDTGKKDSELSDKTDIAVPVATYYLVRRDGGQIKVYFVDETGSVIELETTEILYEMLGPEDQKLFDEGCRVDTQEQLAVLLQDFES